MNQPASAWPPAAAPEGAAPHDVPAGPPLTMAPPAPTPLVPQQAPAAPAAPPAPAGFAMPTGAAALDVAAPLMPVAQPAAPALPEAPTQSLAMPQYEPVDAMPEQMHVHVQVNEGPAPVVAVAAASRDDFTDLSGQRQLAADAAPAAAPDLDGQLWLPGTFLVAGLAAVAWQLVALYVGFVLPVRTASGATLDNFDSLVTSIPLMASWPTSGIIGALLALVTLTLVGLGYRRGVREPVLQGAGALLGFAPVALLGLAPTLFPAG